MNAHKNTIIQVAIQAAYEGGRSTLGYFRTQRYLIEQKEDQSPVTEADKSAEKIIVSVIQRHFPDHAILGEEFGEIDGKSPYRWIIDPIDGTKSFIHHVPLYGTTIGVENRETGEIEAGVCYFPAMDDMLSAQTGGGTFLNGRQVFVSSTSTINQALLLLTDITDLSKTGIKFVFDELSANAGLIRNWGDCFGHKLIASGKADIMFDPWMKIWDIAPLIPIIREAGGDIFSWDGTPVLNAEAIISCNRNLSGMIKNSIEKHRHSGQE